MIFKCSYEIIVQEKRKSGKNVSYATFIRYRPFYVLKLNVVSRDTCLRKTRTNIELAQTTWPFLVMTNHIHCANS